jgi:hypothetical protein
VILLVAVEILVVALDKLDAYVLKLLDAVVA